MDAGNRIVHIDPTETPIPAYSSMREMENDLEQVANRSRPFEESDSDCHMNQIFSKNEFHSSPAIENAV